MRSLELISLVLTVRTFDDVDGTRQEFDPVSASGECRSF
jgi:hypothetical protein